MSTNESETKMTETITLKTGQTWRNHLAVLAGLLAHHAGIELTEEEKK